MGSGMPKYRALTNDSKTHQDFKDVEPKKFSEFASNKKHYDYFCRQHAKDRLKQYCSQDALVDVILTGTDLNIESTVHEGYACSVVCCTSRVMYKITRTDNF